MKVPEMRALIKKYKKEECPALSKMKKEQLMAFIEEHKLIEHHEKEMKMFADASAHSPEEEAPKKKRGGKKVVVVEGGAEKPKRKLTAWNIYVKENRKPGVDLKELSKMFKAQKGGAPKAEAPKAEELGNAFKSMNDPEYFKDTKSNERNDFFSNQVYGKDDKVLIKVMNPHLIKAYKAWCKRNNKDCSFDEIKKAEAPAPAVAEKKARKPRVKVPKDLKTLLKNVAPEASVVLEKIEKGAKGVTAEDLEVAIEKAIERNEAKKENMRKPRVAGGKKPRARKGEVAPRVPADESPRDAIVSTTPVLNAIKAEVVNSLPAVKGQSKTQPAIPALMEKVTQMRKVGEKKKD